MALDAGISASRDDSESDEGAFLFDFPQHPVIQSTPAIIGAHELSMDTSFSSDQLSPMHSFFTEFSHSSTNFSVPLNAQSSPGTPTGDADSFVVSGRLEPSLSVCSPGQIRVRRISTSPTIPLLAEGITVRRPRPAAIQPNLKPKGNKIVPLPASVSSDDDNIFYPPTSAPSTPKTRPRQVAIQPQSKGKIVVPFPTGVSSDDDDDEAPASFYPLISAPVTPKKRSKAPTTHASTKVQRELPEFISPSLKHANKTCSPDTGVFDGVVKQRTVKADPRSPDARVFDGTVKQRIVKVDPRSPDTRVFDGVVKQRVVKADQTPTFRGVLASQQTPDEMVATPKASTKPRKRIQVITPEDVAAVSGSVSHVKQSQPSIPANAYRVPIPEGRKGATHSKHATPNSSAPHTGSIQTQTSPRAEANGLRVTNNFYLMAMDPFAAASGSARDAGYDRISSEISALLEGQRVGSTTLDEIWMCIYQSPGYEPPNWMANLAKNGVSEDLFDPILNIMVTASKDRRKTHL